MTGSRIVARAEPGGRTRLRGLPRAARGAASSRLWSWAWPASLGGVGLGFALIPLLKGRVFFLFDNAHQHFVQTVFLHRSLRAGHVPQWWPDVGSGMPVVAEGQSAHYQPLRLLLALLFSPGTSFMLEAGVYLAVAGIATYFFLRELRLARPAAFLGGLCQVLGSYSIVSLDNIALHRSFFLMPLAMLLAEKYATTPRPRYLAAASVVLGYQFLAGHPTFAIVTAVATAVYLACRLVQRCWVQSHTLRESTQLAARRLAAWAGAVLLGAGIGAIQVLPTLLHIKHSIRAGGLSFRYAVMESLPASVPYLQQLLYPYAYRQGEWLATPTWWGSYFNAVPFIGLYVGALPICLAFMAIWWRRRAADPLWPLLACALAATALALGPSTPLYPALWSLPGLGGLRFPSRFLMWTGFSLACLAALGLHRLLARSRSGRTRRKDLTGLLVFGAVAALPGIVMVATDGFTAASAAHLSPGYRRGIAESMGLLGISALLTAAILGTRGARRAALIVVALAFVGTDLLVFRERGHYAHTVSLEKIFTPPPHASVVRADPGGSRVMSLIPAEAVRNRTDDLVEFLQANTSALWGIQSSNVFMSLLLKRYYAVHEGLVWELLNTPAAATKLAGYLGALNIKYVVAPGQAQLKGWKRVGATARATIWQNPRFLPRAFLVGDVVAERIEIRDEWFDRSVNRLEKYYEMVADWWPRREDSQIVDNILARPVDYATTAVVAADPLPRVEPGGSGGKVTWREQLGDVLRLEVQADRASFLVISNNFYPGWEARVNGEPAAVYRTDYVGMGVAVPAGRSEVVLRFRTPGVPAGLLLTLLSLGIAAGIVAAGWPDVRRSPWWALRTRSSRGIGES